MNIVEKLDLAIKLKEVGTTDGAYEVLYNGDKRRKRTYMRNDEWKKLFDNMPEITREEFGNGGGAEMSEKNGRPPKMACYGSSSRMTYMLSWEKEDFHFEKKLPTTVGGQANLDGFFEAGDYYFFVEAKCHEPYSTKNNVVSVCYERLYKYINACMQDRLHIDMKCRTTDHNMNVEYFAGGEKIIHFDLKQMICHLLGVATGLLKGKLARKQIEFIYLFYDPTGLDICADARSKINEIYERTCYECNLVDFRELFRVIVEFLLKEKFKKQKIEDYSAIIDSFSFMLVSHELYAMMLPHIAKTADEETFYITKDFVDGTKEVVCRLKCNNAQAHAVFLRIICEQQKEYRRSHSERWRIIRLFDSKSKAEICHES